MSTTNTFVGRERQLAELDHCLDRAVAGHGQVCFITGDAGAGKTALAAEFQRAAEERCKDLVVAVAMGDPQTGASDPYLIFREVLGVLTGDVEARLAQGAITQEGARRVQGALRTSIDCVVEFGPDLIGLLVPGANLAVQVTKIGIEASKRAGLLDRLTKAPPPSRSEVPGHKGIDQGQVFEQYAKVLNALAKHAPLLLILDDLQWADTSSIDLLFHLARRIESSRICIVAMYRPAETALGRAGQRHPLDKVVTEIKRYYGDVIIDLDAAAHVECAAFIDALLDGEPNRLGRDFRRALGERTGGNPLFVVELLRDLDEAGKLARDEHGRWIEGPNLDWSTLPARAEGVIESRISRLSADLLEALKLASVQGDAFTAEVVAQIRELNAREFVRQLSVELERRHRLVTSQGQQRVGEQRLSQYQFQNRLFQQYLYAALDPTERAYLHEDIGRALEAIYAGQTDAIAARLGWHFEQAGVADKARGYLRRAGEQATERHAHSEAGDFFTRALALAPEAERAERFDLIFQRATANDRLGRREAQGQDVDALERLAQALGEATRQADAAWQRAICQEARHDYAGAASACQSAVEWAQKAGDVQREVKGRLIWAITLNRQGDFRAAITQADEARAQAETADLKALWADSLRLMGAYEHNLGNWAAASGHLTEARQCFLALGDRRGEAKVADDLGWLLLDEHRYAEALAEYEFSLAVYRETGDRRGEAVALNNLGGVHIAMGNLEGAQSSFEQSLPISRNIGERMVEGAAHVNLSTIHRMQGDYEQALRDAEAAGAIFEAVRSPYGQSHSWLRIGHAQAGAGRFDAAIEAYGRAIALHGQLGNATLALEPQAGLARVRLAQGDAPAALADLAPILDHLHSGGHFDGTEEPSWIYLTCHDVLRANHDPRAGDLLADAHRRLMEQAADFSDERARRMFLANIPPNREIVRAATGEDPAAPEPAPARELEPIPEPAAEPAPPASAPRPEPAVALRDEPALVSDSAPPSPAHAHSAARDSNPMSRLRAWFQQRRPEAFGRAAFFSSIALAGLAVVSLALPHLSEWLHLPTWPRPQARNEPVCPPACAGVDLSGQQRAGAAFVGADLGGASLYASRLSGANLTAAVLGDAVLAAADLSDAVLRGADLRGVDLRGANLQRVDLTSADLRGATLIGADLSGADLTDADLTGANLAAAQLAGAILEDVRHDTTTRWPHGFEPPAAP